MSATIDTCHLLAVLLQRHQSTRLIHATNSSTNLHQMLKFKTPTTNLNKQLKNVSHKTLLPSTPAATTTTTIVRNCQPAKTTANTKQSVPNKTSPARTNAANAKSLSPVHHACRRPSSVQRSSASSARQPTSASTQLISQVVAAAGNLQQAPATTATAPANNSHMATSGAKQHLTRARSIAGE